MWATPLHPQRVFMQQRPGKRVRSAVEDEPRASLPAGFLPNVATHPPRLTWDSRGFVATQNRPTQRLLIWNRDRHLAAARPQFVLGSVG